ncbi:hypothetical protein HOO65_070074 [Ceratocystis lukuohia]|uniref:Uncharacterized protein n=1 Tax=Ceratocystis lukuohia TaxID=2019550 RepID=A0ABR4MBG0_9PEZI
MKFLLFLTFCCTIVFGAIIPSPPDLKPSPAMADDPTGPLQLHKLLSRGSSDAYKEAKRAANEKGVTLENDEYYYFMSCNTVRAGFTPSEPAVRYVFDQTGGCTHVALVVGKITKTSWTKKFEATYLNASDSPSGTAWKQSVNDYSPRSNQKLIYGGKAVWNPDIDSLSTAGNNWLRQANVGGPGGGRQYSPSMNCLNYYYDLRDMVAA